jgi:hypothetical protein
MLPEVSQTQKDKYKCLSVGSPCIAQEKWEVVVLSSWSQPSLQQKRIMGTDRKGRILGVGRNC